MDNRDREDLCNSAPDEVTIAREKKRLRRVSFAENTEIFHFDKDYESDHASTDPTPSPQNSELKVGLGFLKNFDDSDDSKELSRYEDEYGEDDDDEPNGFLQRMDSSSPGSGFGSATSNTSNEDDEFFGAVSTSFIRSGLSDSAVSNDNDELTLDARTFTEQFRHLLPPNSEGNYKTPTRTPLTFDGKTPQTGSSMGTDAGSLMALTGLEKVSPAASVSGGKSSGGGGDMSLIEENPCMFDYGRLSPTLEANLAIGSEISNDLLISYQADISAPSNFVSVNNGFETSVGFDNGLMLKDTGAIELENTDIQHPSSELVSEVSYRLSEEKGGGTSILGHISAGSTHNTLAIASGDAHHSHDPTSATNMLSATATDSTRNVLKVVDGSDLEIDGRSHHPLTPPRETNQIDMMIPNDHGDVGHVERKMMEGSFNNAIYTPENGFKTSQSSKLEESISSLTAKRREIFPQTNVLSKSHESTSAMNLLSAMDANSARDAPKVVGGSGFEFGGSSHHPLTSRNERNNTDMTTPNDRGDIGHVQHRMTEDSSNSARYTPESGFKTSQSSKLEESISSLTAKRREIFPQTNVLSKSHESISATNLLSAMDADSARDAPKVVGGSGFEFGGSSHHPLTSRNERNNTDMTTPNDRGDVGHVQHRMTEDSSNSARCTPESGFKTSQSSKLEESISSLTAKRREIFPQTNVLSKSHESISATNLLSAMDADSARDAPKVVGGSDFEFGGSGRHPLASRNERNNTDMTTQNDRGDIGHVEHRTTEDSSNNARYTPESRFKTNQSSKLEEPISLLNAELQERSPPSNVFSKSESSVCHVVERMNEDSFNDASCTPEVGIKTNQSSKSSQEGSVSLLSAERRQIFRPTLVLSRSESVVTPSSGEQPISPSNNGNVREQGAILANMNHSSPQLSVEPVKVDSLLNVILTCDPALEQHDNNLSFIANDSETHTLSKSKLVNSAGFLRHGMQKETQITTSHVTPLRYMSTLNPQSGSPESNFRSRTAPDRLKEKVPEKISSCGPASTCVRKRTATPTRLDKRLMDWLPHYPSTKETNMSSENVGGQQDPGCPKLISIQDAGHSGKKRRIEQISFMDNGNIEPIRIQKSPKVAPELEGAEKNDEAEMDGDNALPRDWDHIFSHFSEAMKQQLLPLADNLNFKEVCVLDDTLVRLEKVNKYKVLCNEIKSQKIHNLDVYLLKKRVAEARYMQQMLIYKQAKLQLLHLRQERVHKKFQSFHSAIKEIQILSKSFSNLSKRDAAGVLHDDSCKTSFLDDQNGKLRDEVTAKRQELGALDRKVKELTQSLISSCKIKMEPSSDVVELVNDHLKRKAANRFVRQHLQLWEVVGLERKSSQYDLLLNYCDFLHQRFSVNVGPASSIVATIKLIDVNIMKSFTNINASVAFAFVFSAMSSRNLGSGRNLALETQLTSLLLRNLLDVVEEAYTVHIELNNLIKTSFHSPTVDQLDLQLQFIDFKTGCKVTLALDMTSLQRGVYPSEILPSKLQTNSPASQLHSAEILSGIGALQAGHSRIIRLCRCVSQVLKARNV